MNVLDWGIGAQVNLLKDKEIITMVFLAELEGVIARHGFAVSKGFLGTTE